MKKKDNDRYGKVIIEKVFTMYKLKCTNDLSMIYKYMRVYKRADQIPRLEKHVQSHSVMLQHMSL